MTPAINSEEPAARGRLKRPADRMAQRWQKRPADQKALRRLDPALRVMSCR